MGTIGKKRLHTLNIVWHSFISELFGQMYCIYQLYIGYHSFTSCHLSEAMS
jgi:hypothetical protein